MYGFRQEANPTFLHDAIALCCIQGPLFCHVQLQNIASLYNCYSRGEGSPPWTAGNTLFNAAHLVNSQSTVTGSWTQFMKMSVPSPHAPPEKLHPNVPQHESVLLCCSSLRVNPLRSWRCHNSVRKSYCFPELSKLELQLQVVGAQETVWGQE